MRKAEKEISEYSAIKEIIREADVCRLAIANDNIPYIVAMNFGYSDEPVRRLFFHCANEGRKLDMIRKNNYVCFAMDTNHRLYSGKDSCDWGMKFSSVVGYGFITIVRDKESKKTGLDSIMEHYGAKKPYHYNDEVLGRTTILSLDITEITGKKC